jgi:hypothetical protein
VIFRRSNERIISYLLRENIVNFVCKQGVFRLLYRHGRGWGGFGVGDDLVSMRFVRNF